MEHRSPSELVGMLHIPVNTILAAPARWRQSLALPDPRPSDWEIIRSLELPTAADRACRDDGATLVEDLSFFPFLVDRLLAEAGIYVAAGVDALMIENVAGPYFVRHHQPAVVYWLMGAMAARLRAAHPDRRLGIQILAFSDDWAMDIACRHGFAFVRSESALFEGLRPEGRTPNAGNLAALYMTRSRLSSALSHETLEPEVWVDLHKKHTLFDPCLDPVEVWLENLLFQKLEGVIVTGGETGSPVEEADLAGARRAIDEVAERTARTVGTPWRTTLVAGSGIEPANAGLYRRLADAVIVGSTLKENGYWECPVDPVRVRALIDAWHG